jgi:Raf kinase inhibitor-like YbhB/YbcL family protein
MTSPNPFTLTSSAFDDGAPIPRASTCDGAGRSPALDWTGAPADTQALVLVVIDPDARDFVHWVAFDMTGAPEGHLAAGLDPSATAPAQGQNGFGKRGYGGPCPPSGQHHYRFTLSALDRPLGIGGTPSLAEVRAAMKGHVLAEATLNGTYRRS